MKLVLKIQTIKINFIFELNLFKHKVNFYYILNLGNPFSL